MNKNIEKLFVVFSLAVVVISCNNGEKKPLVEEKITPLTNHWEFAIPNQEVPEGLSSLSAEQCGSCHQDHYKEWKTSTHAHAWTDLQFQSELKKESSPFMCINCHIPLQNQQEYLIKGLINGDIYRPVKEKNPHFDKDLQQEGINCASCHVRNNVIIGPTGTDKAPHKTIKDTSHLSEQLCISCHNANAVVTPTLACTFETGDEWKSGPFYGEKSCITCHMEETHREVVAGYGERKSRFHGFPGSGIPKRTDYEPAKLEGLSFKETKPKKKYDLNEDFSYSITLKNEYAGHRLPTGDPERFYIIRMVLSDEEGNLLASKEDRIGEEWEWYPVAKKLSDNNLNPGEVRAYDLVHPISDTGNYLLTVLVTKHRMNEETAAYNKLGSEYPLYIQILKKEYRFIVQ